MTGLSQRSNQRPERALLNRRMSVGNASALPKQARIGVKTGNRLCPARAPQNLDQLDAIDVWHNNVRHNEFR